jgi:hypothetical protein
MNEPAPIPIPVPLAAMPAKGATVFLFEKRPSGSWKHTPCEVVDLNEHVKAVKVSYSRVAKIINEWLPLSKLTASAPMEEKK